MYRQNYITYFISKTSFNFMYRQNYITTLSAKLQSTLCIVRIILLLYQQNVIKLIKVSLELYQNFISKTSLNFMYRQNYITTLSAKMSLNFMYRQNYITTLSAKFIKLYLSLELYYYFISKTSLNFMYHQNYITTLCISKTST